MDGHTPLMEAAILGHYEMMYVLLEAGADPRARNNKGDMASYYLLDGVINRPRIRGNGEVATALHGVHGKKWY